ncbi:MAG: alpha/beta hydrolase, partial [Solirubrobacteraceae bacterium]|nr:alpha/beta hydrolase [Solirubrobacteraceae bacterium]
MRSRPLPWHPVGLAAVAAVAGVVLLAGLIALRGRTLAALLIRRRLDAGAAEMSSALRAHDPGGVAELRDERYGPAPDNLLDVYWSEQSGGAPVGPAVVWVHGGGWLANDKADASAYFRLLAAAGFTVVAVNYSRAPRHRYPAPVRDVDAALAHLQRHASRLRIDPTRVVLAGDSAGAQLAAQVAAIITNPAYAERMGLASALPAAHLRGVVLCCGVYDLLPYVRGETARVSATLGFVLDTVLWAYTGESDPQADVFAELSVMHH